jgi:hypothetical protein
MMMKKMRRKGLWMKKLKMKLELLLNMIILTMKSKKVMNNFKNN